MPIKSNYQPLETTGRPAVPTLKDVASEVAQKVRSYHEAMKQEVAELRRDLNMPNASFDSLASLADGRLQERGEKFSEDDSTEYEFDDDGNDTDANRHNEGLHDDDAEIPGTEGNFTPTIVEIPNEEKLPDFTLEMSRDTQRQLNPAKVKEQIDYVISRLLSGNRIKKWTANYTSGTPDYNGLSKTYTYTVTIAMTPNPYIKGKSETEFEAIQELADTAATTQRWVLTKYGSETLVEGKTRVQVSVPNDWYDAYFGHIYERRPQIEILMSAVQAGIQSNFENRFHTILYGPPACGKSEIMRTFKEMLGEDACMEYDATSTTQAGAIRDLANREVIPQVLFIEEIEKTDEASLRWLLAVLDFRAEIRNTNYREQVQREVKLLCIASANDFDLFRKLMYGALASRFTHKIYCPRPDETILTRILSREVRRANGDEAWIKPAIKYALSHNMNDPRQVAAICLCGREQLLDGTYQEFLESCQGPDADDDVADI